jgi:hypothetical protein
MSLETLGSLGAFENKKDIKLELQEIRDMQDKREELQKRWNELFEQEQTLDSKYPNEVKWTEDRKFKSDRSFYTPEDLEIFRAVDAELKQVETERNEMDKEIIKRRFETGVKYLQEINGRNDLNWRLTKSHDPDPNNPMDILRVREYRCVFDDIDARIQFTYEAVPDFFEGMGKVAKAIGDTELEEKIGQMPKRRELPYNEMHGSFSVGPKTFLRSNTDLWPGVSMQKIFDPYDKNLDKVNVSFPISISGYSFPQIEESKREHAKEEMLKLTQKLGTE